MKRVVDVLYGLRGYPNAARFTDFKTDFKNYDYEIKCFRTNQFIGNFTTGK